MENWKHGWKSPTADLNEYEIDNQGFAHKRSRKRNLITIIVAIFSLFVIYICAVLAVPPMVQNASKFPTPTDRTKVSAEARYP